MNAAAQTRPFTGLRAFELGDDPACELTGRLMAEMGCEVIKLEPPRGAASRHIGPYLDGGQGVEHSLNFRFYNNGKKSVVEDLKTDAGMDGLRARLQDADVLIVAYRPSELAALGLDYGALQSQFPRLVILSITPYGLTGPWSDYLASELTAMAGGGPLIMSGYDDHSIPPIKPGGNQAHHTAASFAYGSTVLALLQRRIDGLGQLVDVSIHEANAITTEISFPVWTYAHASLSRQTCRHAQPEPTQEAVFLCADGRYVYYVMLLHEAKAWRMLVEWLDDNGLAADLKDPEYDDVAHRQANVGHVQGIVECLFQLKPAYEVFREAQKKQLPVGIIYAPEDLLEDEHFISRDLFVAVEEAAGTVTYVRPPYRFTAFDFVPRGLAPRLGEHG